MRTEAHLYGVWLSGGSTSCSADVFSDHLVVGAPTLGPGNRRF